MVSPSQECISLWPADLAEREYRGAKAELEQLTSEAN
jgi:hypothetical protein